jgi:[ribosomal protein S5]-alanine N-acetyltransferase
MPRDACRAWRAASPCCADRQATARAMRPFDTARLRLEPQVAGHAPAMFEVLSDPAIYEFENEPPPSVAWLVDRYGRLESRQSPDGSEAWLNWVVRLPGGELAGTVQATVLSEDGLALVAYELASRHWRQGIGREAVSGLLDELALQYGATHFAAILKCANYRSAGLLRCLGFSAGPPSLVERFEVLPDEMLMHRALQVDDLAS